MWFSSHVVVAVLNNGPQTCYTDAILLQRASFFLQMAPHFAPSCMSISVRPELTCRSIGILTGKKICCSETFLLNFVNGQDQHEEGKIHFKMVILKQIIQYAHVRHATTRRCFALTDHDALKFGPRLWESEKLYSIRYWLPAC